MRSSLSASKATWEDKKAQEVNRLPPSGQEITEVDAYGFKVMQTKQLSAQFCSRFAKQQTGCESACVRSLLQPARPPHSENSDSSSSRATGSAAASWIARQNSADSANSAPGVRCPEFNWEQCQN